MKTILSFLFLALASGAYAVEGLPAFDFIGFAQLRPRSSAKDAIRAVVDGYAGESARRYGTPIQLVFDDADIAQATGGIVRGGIPEITIYAGLIKGMTAEEAVAAACHEIGHVLGRVAFESLPDQRPASSDSNKDSVEGEADYFSGRCVYDHLRRAFDAPEAEAAALAADIVTRTLEKIYGTKIDYRTAEGEIFPGIDPSYPDKECRLLSAISGVGLRQRPKCWYNPR